MSDPTPTPTPPKAPYNNFVKLVMTDGSTATLKLESEWTVTPGIQPNVNNAIVSYKEFDAISGSASQIGSDLRQQCKIQFFFTPGLTEGEGTEKKAKPDVELKGHHIVDVEPLTIGRPIGPGQAGGYRIVEYRLSISDARDRFIHPRGGFLSQGEINKQPFVKDPKGVMRDANGQAVIDTNILIETCLRAMGVFNDTDIPDGLFGDLPPTPDLQWYANHAPTELAKLLEPAGLVFVVLADGTYAIARKGEGDAPVMGSLPLPPMVIPNLDRRGKSVVFVSAPIPVVNTQTFDGPEDDTFDFVIEDKDGTWKKYKDAVLLKGKDPLTEFKNGCTGVDEVYRDRVYDQLYRCIMMDPDTYGPCKIMSYLTEAGKPAAPPVVMAKVGIEDVNSGIYFNTTDKVALRIDYIKGGGRVLQTNEVMLQLQAPSLSEANAIRDVLAPKFKDVQIKVTFEVWDHDATAARWSPRFFRVGYQQRQGGLQKLNDAEIDNVLAGNDAIIVPMPAWQLHLKEEEEQNRKELEGYALALAPTYVRGSGDDGQILAAVGFVPVDAGGVVSEIRYQQDPPKTTVKTNTWYLPHGLYLKRDKDEKKDRGEEAFPKQAATQAVREAQGMSSAVRSVVPIDPAPDRGSPETTVLVSITKAGTAVAEYEGDVKVGVAGAPGKKWVIRNQFPDDNNAISHWLPNGDYIGKVVPNDGAGDAKAIIKIDSNRCGAVQDPTPGAARNDQVTIGKADVDTVAAMSDKLLDTAAKGPKIINMTVITRVASDASAVYGYFRTLIFSCGVLKEITDEVQKKIADLVDCPT